MKISIQLEVEPEEVGLAAELLSTLRAFTDHVSVVSAKSKQASGPSHANGPMTPAASAPPSHLSSAGSGPAPPAPYHSGQQPSYTGPPHAPPSAQQQQQQQPPPMHHHAAPPQHSQGPPPQSQMHHAPPPQQQQAQAQGPPAGMYPPPHQQQHPQQQQQPPQPQQQQQQGQPASGPPPPQQQAPPQQQQQAPPGAPPPGAPAGLPPLDPGQLRAMLSRLEDPNQLDAVSAELGQLLAPYLNPHNPDSPAHFATFFDAFLSVVFNPQLLMQPAPGEPARSVVPYMNLLPRLPEPAKAMMRDKLIPRVLKHLTFKRPVDINRIDFFLQAEAFAALVFLEFVSPSGAVQTIKTLLDKRETRCAAITMLGKTVELCYHQLEQKCPPDSLTALRASLANCIEPVFEYDVKYINEYMGWKDAGAEGQ